LHPLYGEVNSVKDRTVVYCPTKKSGEKCKEIVRCLEIAGAKIIVLDAEEHDKQMAIVQNARKKLFEAYGLLIEQSGFNIKELYEISPPPTKILIDLIARQADEQSEELYNAMEKYNPNDSNVKKHLIESLENSREASKKIRNLFGKELRNSQERARKLIERD
jgi:prephenate dehydrogenase